MIVNGRPWGHVTAVLRTTEPGDANVEWAVEIVRTYVDTPVPVGSVAAFLRERGSALEHASGDTVHIDRPAVTDVGFVEMLTGVHGPIGMIPAEAQITSLAGNGSFPVNLEYMADPDGVTIDAARANAMTMTIMLNQPAATLRFAKSLTADAARVNIFGADGSSYIPVQRVEEAGSAGNGDRLVIQYNQAAGSIPGSSGFANTGTFSFTQAAASWAMVNSYEPAGQLVAPEPTIAPAVMPAV